MLFVALSFRFLFCFIMFFRFSCLTNVPSNFLNNCLLAIGSCTVSNVLTNESYKANVANGSGNVSKYEINTPATTCTSDRCNSSAIIEFMLLIVFWFWLLLVSFISLLSRCVSKCVRRASTSATGAVTRNMPEEKERKIKIKIKRMIQND